MTSRRLHYPMSLSHSTPNPDHACTILLYDSPPPFSANFTAANLCIFSFLGQLHSRSCLQISETGLNLLLNCIVAFPPFASVLRAFTAVDVPYHDGSCALHA